MFEKRTKNERIIIYAVIAFIVTVILASIHYFFQAWNETMVLIVAVIEYVCIFYILYLPLKYETK